MVSIKILAAYNSVNFLHHWIIEDFKCNNYFIFGVLVMVMRRENRINRWTKIIGKVCKFLHNGLNTEKGKHTVL